MNPRLKVETWGARFDGYGNEMAATGHERQRQERLLDGIKLAVETLG